MLIAITGAGGFLGRYLVEEFATQGHRCRGLTRTAPHDPAMEWVVGPLADPATLRKLIDGADAVIHAAHDQAGRNFLAAPSDPVAFVEQNLIGTIRLIELAQQAEVRRMIVISSGAVHDDILHDRPLDETHPLWPRSHYGATKAAIEAFVHSYGRGGGFPICALRPTAIYGRAEPLAASRWFDLISAIVRGEDVACRKGGKLVHARDVARAAHLLLTVEGVSGEVYHCTDQFIAEREVAEIARSVVASRSRIEGDAPRTRHEISCEKLKRLGMNFGGPALLRATVRDLAGGIAGQNKAEVPNDPV